MRRRLGSYPGARGWGVSLHELRRKANEALARRWLASKHWGGWRVGMRCQITGRVCVGATPSGNAVWHCEPGVRDGVGGGLPCLDHPGTRAFLLEDVRRAWGRAVAVAMPCERRPEFAAEIERSDEWPCYWHRYTGRTEAAALIAALDAAP